MFDRDRPIPIYSTPGDCEAFLYYPNLFNLSGEWVGWVTEKDEVYSVYGAYIGWITKEPRILRKRTYDYDKPKLSPPNAPKKMSVLGTVPLPPMMAELSFDTIDVLFEEPERLSTMDVGEFRPDMD